MAAKPVIYDDDAPELTDAELAEFRPARDVMGKAEYEAATSVRKGRPKSANPKVSVTFRLDPAVVEALKSTGRGWHTRAGATLAQSVGITVTPDGKPLAPLEGHETARGIGKVLRSPKVKSSRSKGGQIG